MSSLLQRLFKRRKKAAPEATGGSFAARFHHFKLFLSAYLAAYSEMMSFEERLADDLPIGMPFLRSCTTKLAVASMKCIMQLNTLGDNRFSRLSPPFSALRQDIQTILGKGLKPLEGPLALPYEAISEEHADIVSYSLCKLGAVGKAYPHFIPKGFVVTGAAWWRYFNDPAMHDEIDRIMLISQEDSSSYSEAGARIREGMTASFPLPEDLTREVRELLQSCFTELHSPGYSLLVRSIPVCAEHSALVIPEQLLHTPVDAQSVINAIQASLTMAYRPRAILYRLKRGIRDRAMPLNVAVSLIPRRHARGSAHRKLETLNAEALFVHVRRSFTTPEQWPVQCAMEGASLPAPIRNSVESCSRAALDCLADAPVTGNRHEIFWVASPDDDFYVLGVNALPDPAAPASCPPEHTTPAFRGGFSTYPGLARGRVKLVRNYADALAFPIGNIMVLPRSGPRWSFLLDFASGAIVGDGTGNGLFARTARRYGRPTILGQPEAFASLSDGQLIHMLACADHEPEIWLPPEEEDNGSSPVHDGTAGVPGAAYPLNDAAYAAPTWLPSSDIANMTRELAPKVVSLTLPDSDDMDFRAENCKTFHDFLVYCHVHAVREMFRAGTSVKSAQAPAKQLVCDVPKQFWIINLDDGFYGEIPGPVVRLEEVASLPMRSLWEGFSDKPWDGPPQLNARGFLSVLFEATANPNLDPASQSTQYTEKNIFLIARRFCSMRCRFGFHFLSMDCLLGERERERFVVFQFKGGAANLSRRIRRVHFVAELLAQFDFVTEVANDILTARLEQGTEEAFLSALRVLGYLVMHTRQLDMIMNDDQALAAHRTQMLADMHALAAREPLSLP